MLIFCYSYQHIIIAIRSQDPPIETLGGILADDMGLGKTLTVLSTIIRTAGISKQFAEENNGNHEIRDSGNLMYSKATLVVVPLPSMNH